MKLTLNFEAPGRSTTELAALLHQAFCGAVKVRVQDTSYQGPEGLVHTRTFIAQVFTVHRYELVVKIVHDLSRHFGQDCIAVRRIDEAGGTINSLIGPRADKWLPFNPAYFVEY